MGANSKPTTEQPIDTPTSPQGAVGSGRAHAPFTQRQNESDVAYAAFLLWCMQTPDCRSNRLLARSMSTAESNIRHWKKKFAWDMRAARVQDPEYEALRLYRASMEKHVGQDNAKMMRAALDLVLNQAGYAKLRESVQKQRVGIDAGKSDNVVGPITHVETEQLDPARYLRDLGYKIRQKHLKETDVSKQVMLIDAVLGLIARRVQDGSLQVKVGDIPNLIKARSLLTGLPTEHLAVQQHVTHDITVTETPRVSAARVIGTQEAYVKALKEEVSELSAVLGAIPTIIEVESE